MSIFLKFPFAVIQGTDLSSFEPSGDAMEMECVLQMRKSIKYLSKGGKTSKHTLQTPQATVHSSEVADAWFA